MNSMKSKSAPHWHARWFPRIIGFTTILTSALYYSLSTKEAEALAPLYLRTAVWFFAWTNFFSGATHWLLKPSGGLEKIARLPISPKSSLEKSFMQLLQGQEGLGRVFQSIALFYIVTKKIELTLPCSVWAASQQVLMVLTTMYYKKVPMLSDGTSSTKHAPGRFRKYFQSLPIVAATIYACLTENV